MSTPQRLQQRDEGLRRITRLRGGVAVAGVTLAGALALVAARAQPGTVRSSATTSASAVQPALTPPPSSGDDQSETTVSPNPPSTPPASTMAPPQTATGGS